MFNWMMQMITMFQQYIIPTVVVMLTIATSLIAYNQVIFGLLVAAAATVIYGVAALVDPDRDRSITFILSAIATLAFLFTAVIL